MKHFFYFSISVLCLAIAALIGFHIGSRSVEAQSTDLPIEGYSVVQAPADSPYFHHYVIYSNGDVYRRTLDVNTDEFTPEHLFVGNFFDGEAPVNASESTWGNIKNQLKK